MRGHQHVKQQQRFPHVHMVPESDKPQPIDMRIFRAAKRRLAFSAPITETGGHFIGFHTVYKRRPFDGEKPPTLE